MAIDIASLFQNVFFPLITSIVADKGTSLIEDGLVSNFILPNEDEKLREKIYKALEDYDYEQVDAYLAKHKLYSTDYLNTKLSNSELESIANNFFIEYPGQIWRKKQISPIIMYAIQEAHRHVTKHLTPGEKILYGKIDQVKDILLDKLNKLENSLPDQSDPRSDDVLCKDIKKLGNFPTCYVEHNGLIEYLPTLLEVTPYAYTYIIASNNGENASEALNTLQSKHHWMEFTPNEFFTTTQITVASKIIGIIVNIRVMECQLIRQVLEHRDKHFFFLPLAINLFSNEFEVSKVALRDIYLDDYTINQFEVLYQTSKFNTYQLPGIKELASLKSNNFWRLMLSYDNYYSDAIERSDSEIAKFLLYQGDEMLKNRSDVDYANKINKPLAEKFDRDEFKKKPLADFREENT